MHNKQVISVEAEIGFSAIVREGQSTAWLISLTNKPDAIETLNDVWRIKQGEICFTVADSAGFATTALTMSATSSVVNSDFAPVNAFDNGSNAGNTVLYFFCRSTRRVRDISFADAAISSSTISLRPDCAAIRNVSLSNDKRSRGLYSVKFKHFLNPCRPDKVRARQFYSISGNHSLRRASQPVECV
jgi:hypothetical protein